MENTMEPNTCYPGRPNYTGPEEGDFAFVWHDQLLTYMPSHSMTITARIKEIRRTKPENEIAHRLHCMVYLSPDRLPETVVQTQEKLDQAEKWKDRAEEKLDQAEEKLDRAEEKFDQAVDARGLVEEELKRAYNLWRRTMREHETEILALITELVPDHTWNGKELVFKAVDDTEGKSK